MKQSSSSQTNRQANRQTNSQTNSQTNRQANRQAGKPIRRDNVTSIDVAKLAGVSQSAVSRVFTKGASASKATAEKVKKAAQELGYRPNSLARAMVSGKSGIIGVVVAYLQNPFYSDALEKLSTRLQEQGYHVLVFLAANSRGEVDDVIAEILDYQVDGIIAASASLSSELADRCEALGVPMVLFNRLQDRETLVSVTSDNWDGGYQVAQFLIAGRHQRIGYIAGWEGASTQRDREAGFRHGLQEAGVSLFARAVGDFNADIARQETIKMFSQENRPDAVFVANDHMAVAVMDALRFDMGLAIPRDVSVVGYDDMPAASWRGYDLTTVRQPAVRMVNKTVDVLLEQINGTTPKPKPIAIAGTLMIRGSAKIPEGWNDEGV